MIEKLTEKEQKMIISAFEIAYGYSHSELIKVSPHIREIFYKCGVYDIQKR